MQFLKKIFSTEPLFEDRPFDADAKWLWQKIGWLETPDFKEDLLNYALQLVDYEKSLLASMNVDVFNQSMAMALSENIHDSYQIEAEDLDKKQLRSSLIRQLSLDIPEWRLTNDEMSDAEKEKADKAVLATITALNDSSPCTPQWLCDIHRLLQVTTSKIQWGKFRDGPMGVVDSNNNIVYMAPSAFYMKGFMRRFCEWWEEDMPLLPPPISAALAHAFFVVIHPFNDGNGRMARLLADKAMALGMKEPYRPYSMSSVILGGRQTYYKGLDELAEKDGVTNFVSLMLRMQNQAIDFSKERANLIQTTKQLINDINNNSCQQLSLIQETILKTISFYPHKAWTIFEVLDEINDTVKQTLSTSDIMNEWDNLVKRNILCSLGESTTVFFINTDFAVDIEQNYPIL